VTTAIATATTTYSIDKAHSEVSFQVRHLLTKVRGRFSDFNGTIEFDVENPERSLVDVEIRAASIDTNERDRDAHLRSADFFDVEKIPVLTFRSTEIRRYSDQRFTVTGDLTIHGVTRSVSFEASLLGTAKDPWGNERTGRFPRRRRRENRPLGAGGAGARVARRSTDIRRLREPDDLNRYAPRSAGTRCTGNTGRARSRRAARRHLTDRPGMVPACALVWVGERT
jgi:polyisoprenoid-binding protein YceI